MRPSEFTSNTSYFYFIRFRLIGYDLAVSIPFLFVLTIRFVRKYDTYGNPVPALPNAKEKTQMKKPYRILSLLLCLSLLTAFWSSLRRRPPAF